MDGLLLWLDDLPVAYSLPGWEDVRRMGHEGVCVQGVYAQGMCAMTRWRERSYKAPQFVACRGGKTFAGWVAEVCVCEVCVRRLGGEGGVIRHQDLRVRGYALSVDTPT